MASESPLFQSSMELLGHAITHFNGQEELDRKLVILHLANAIELVLKDILLDTGESIYKNPKETITIFGCIQKLKDNGVSVPFLNKIELLIDERNALQHRFGSPNELTAIFYMDIAISFFTKILHNHYDLDFDETIEQFTDRKALAAFRMRKPADETELENLLKLASIHPLGAFLSAMTYLEKKTEDFGKQIGIGERELMRYAGPMSYRLFHRYGINVPQELAVELEEIRRLRNSATHGRITPSEEDVRKAIKVIENYERFLEELDKAKIAKQVKEVIEQRELEKKRQELEQERKREFARNQSLVSHQLDLERQSIRERQLIERSGSNEEEDLPF